MKFCKHCNTETDRYKSGKCMPCVKKFNAAIYAANPEKGRARAKAWNMENKDKVKERDAKRYYSNPEHARARVQRWKA